LKGERRGYTWGPRGGKTRVVDQTGKWRIHGKGRGERGFKVKFEAGVGKKETSWQKKTLQRTSGGEPRTIPDRRGGVKTSLGALQEGKVWKKKIKGGVWVINGVRKGSDGGKGWGVRWIGEQTCHKVVRMRGMRKEGNIKRHAEIG